MIDNRKKSFLTYVDRINDKPTKRPACIAFAAEDSPPLMQRLVMALQQVAIQSVYFIFPAVVGDAFGLSRAQTTAFVCLSIAVVAVTSLLQIITRGPIGSGYAVPSVPTPSFVGAYLIVAGAGGDLGVASVLLVATGAMGVVASLTLPRLQTLIPTEVAGVVVMLIGLSLLPMAYRIEGTAESPLGNEVPLLLTLASLTVMIACSLSKGRLGMYSVLIGAGFGWVLSIPLGLVPADAAALIAETPWFALPAVTLPDPTQFDLALWPAFLVVGLASLASWSGDIIALQRASDGDWRQPDPGPLRRGLVAQSLGLMSAGFLGGMAPGVSSACVGLAIGTHTFSRSIVLTGSLVLFGLACCPKLASCVMLLPDPVKVAMLFYVCCFMIASGARLITSRMLDERRTFVVGLGAVAGIGSMIAQSFFATHVPSAIAGAVSAGALVSIFMNLVTLPLVVRRVSFQLNAAQDISRELTDRCEVAGGSWGARPETMKSALHALIEVSEVLLGRGIESFRVQLRYDEERVSVQIEFAGEELAAPTARPDIEDLEGAEAAREAFALWLATRQANDFAQRRIGKDLVEVQIGFLD